MKTFSYCLKKKVDTEVANHSENDFITGSQSLRLITLAVK